MMISIDKKIRHSGKFLVENITKKSLFEIAKHDVDVKPF